jgi:hypothetical protein
MNDERIRQILREGDPFAEGAGLNPEEVGEMRRTVLTAIPDRRERRFRLLPALALAGAATVAVLIAVLALRPEDKVPANVAPPRMAAVPVPVPPSPAPVVGSAPREETRAAQSRPHHHRKASRPSRTEDSLASLEIPKAPEETSPREIQFTTPGGTRIIWTLVPGKASY